MTVETAAFNISQYTAAVEARNLSDMALFGEMLAEPCELTSNAGGSVGPVTRSSSGSSRRGRPAEQMKPSLE